MYHMYTQYKTETDISAFNYFNFYLKPKKKIFYDEQDIAKLKFWSQLMRKVIMIKYMPK